MATQVAPEEDPPGPSGAERCASRAPSAPRTCSTRTRTASTSSRRASRAACPASGSTRACRRSRCCAGSSTRATSTSTTTSTRTSSATSASGTSTSGASGTWAGLGDGLHVLSIAATIFGCFAISPKMQYVQNSAWAYAYRRNATSGVGYDTYLGLTIYVTRTCLALSSPRHARRGRGRVAELERARVRAAEHVVVVVRLRGGRAARLRLRRGAEVPRRRVLEPVRRVHDGAGLLFSLSLSLSLSLR